MKPLFDWCPFYRIHKVRYMPPLISLAESRVFRLTDFDLDSSDKLELWAALIESGALCSRLSRGRLTQIRPLAALASLRPPLSEKALYDLTDRDCADLVVRLRGAASKMREEGAQPQVGGE